MSMCRCDGVKPVLFRDVDVYLSSPLMLLGLKDDSLLRTLQGMVRNRLFGRSCKTMVGLGRHLAAHAEEGTVSFLHLQLSLRKYHISLTVEVLLLLLLLCNVIVVEFFLGYAALLAASSQQ